MGHGAHRALEILKGGSLLVALPAILGFLVTAPACQQTAGGLATYCHAWAGSATSDFTNHISAGMHVRLLGTGWLGGVGFLVALFGGPRLRKRFGGEG
jgi:hypothetical protein